MQEEESNRIEMTDIDKNESSKCSVNEHIIENISSQKGSGLDPETYEETSESLLNELIDDAVWDMCVEVMNSESVLDELIVDAIWDVCFEVHRAAKLGYFDLEFPEKKQTIVQDAEKDIHGQALKCKAQSFRIPCPICKHESCATKFASHLAKCIGISGRNSSRAASQKIAGLDENKYIDDDDSDSCLNSNKKRPKKNAGKKNTRRKPKAQGNSVSKSSVERNANYQEMTYEERKAFFNQMCGVISKRTNKMCMHSHKCSAHTDEERRDVRHYILRDMDDQLTNDGQIDVDTVDEGSGGLSLYMQPLSTFSTDRNVTSVSGFNEKKQPNSSRNNAASFRKKKVKFCSSSSVSSPSQVVAPGSSFDSL